MPSDLGQRLKKVFGDVKRKNTALGDEKPEDVEAVDLEPMDDPDRDKRFSRLKKLLGYAPKV